MEGLKVATPAFEPYVVPLTLLLLVVLFMVQRRGTGSVGRYFGPVMILWFCSIGILGGIEIARRPSILLAVDPRYAVNLMWHHPWHGFVLLGSVVLAVTGAEALYADMGHFGRSPIRRAWLRFVFPALLLNYFGQGALLLAKPAAIENPFYLLAPGWALYPLVALASTATVIASQAVISGAFSITRQAVQLGYLPRMLVRHTSEQEIGQVYVPAMNLILLVAVVATVISFRSSDSAGRRLWHRRHRHDDGHDGACLCLFPMGGGLAAMAADPVIRVVSVYRPVVFQRQSVEDHRWRLVPAGDRR